MYKYIKNIRPMYNVHLLLVLCIFTYHFVNNEQIEQKKVQRKKAMLSSFLPITYSIYHMPKQYWRATQSEINNINGIYGYILVLLLIINFLVFLLLYLSFNAFYLLILRFFSLSHKKLINIWSEKRAHSEHKKRTKYSL